MTLAVIQLAGMSQPMHRSSRKHCIGTHAEARLDSTAQLRDAGKHGGHQINLGEMIKSGPDFMREKKGRQGSKVKQEIRPSNRNEEG